MALPSSGQLTFSAIATELGITGYGTNGVDLRGMSSDAGFGAPDNISEFYGYSSIVSNSFVTNNGTSTGKGGSSYGFMFGQGSTSGTPTSTDGWGYAQTVGSAFYSQSLNQLRLTLGSSTNNTWWTNLTLSRSGYSDVVYTRASSSVSGTIRTWSSVGTVSILIGGGSTTWTFV